MHSSELDSKMQSLYRDAINIRELTRREKWDWNELARVVKRITETVRRTPFQTKAARGEMTKVIKELSYEFESARHGNAARQKTLIKQKALSLTRLLEEATSGESKQIVLRLVLKELSSVFIDAAKMLPGDREEISSQLNSLIEARRRVRSERVGAGEGSVQSQGIKEPSRHETASASDSAANTQLTPEEECLLLVGGSALIHYLWLELHEVNTSPSTGMNTVKHILEMQDELRQRWDRWMLHHTANYLSAKYALRLSEIIGKEVLALDFNRFLWALVYYEAQLMELVDRHKLNQGDASVIESIRVVKRRIARMRKNLQDTSEAMATS